MQRDNDYIRSLLFEIENHDESILILARTLDQSHGDKKCYHLQLLCDSGYLVHENELAYKVDC